LFQAIRYNLYTNAAKVTARAEFDLAQMIYRKNTYSLEMDWAHLVSPRGTLVKLIVDELDSTVGSAHHHRGLDVRRQHHRPAARRAGDDAGQRGRGDDPARHRRHADKADHRRHRKPDADFSTPFADPGTIVEGKIVGVGSFVSIGRRCKVFDIQRLGNLEARITLLDEARRQWLIRLGQENAKVFFKLLSFVIVVLLASHLI
jgi:hypothetical protein